MKLIKFIALLSLTGFVLTARAIECKGIPWDGDRNLPLTQITPELQSMPRADVLRMAWSEMVVPDAGISMAVPLLHYLYQTEQRDAVRGYFRALELDVTDGREIVPALKLWPKRSPILKKSALTIPELCQIYKSAIAPK